VVDPLGPRPLEPAREFQVWEVVRASLDYIRDTVQITRGDHELLDALIFTAALDANMAPVTRDPALLTTYGGVAVSTPDELRRPVSINAVAKSLRLPFETVRRRFLKLSRAGLCVIGPHGVVVPRGAVTSPEYVAEQRARYDRARGFYQALKVAGALPNTAAAGGSPPAAEPLVRAANWALSEYMLRACSDLIALTDNVMSSLVLLELVLANTRPLATAELPGWTRDPEGAGRPVRIAALAASLRISGETIRRHLHMLEALGFCRRKSGGLVAVAPASAWPRFVRLVETNQANVSRAFTRLRQLGVLDSWDAPVGGPGLRAV
jgi:DNA-binding transcriptional regulator YhcF (GntR family)